MSVTRIGVEDDLKHICRVLAYDWRMSKKDYDSVDGFGSQSSQAVLVNGSTFSERSLQYAFPVCRTCFRFEGIIDMKIHGQVYVACRICETRAIRARLRSGRSCGKNPCGFYLPKTRYIGAHRVDLPND